MKGEDKLQCQISIWQHSVCVGSKAEPQSSKPQAELLRSSRSLQLDRLILSDIAANHDMALACARQGWRLLSRLTHNRAIKFIFEPLQWFSSLPFLNHFYVRRSQT